MRKWMYYMQDENIGDDLTKEFYVIWPHSPPVQSHNITQRIKTQLHSQWRQQQRHSMLLFKNIIIIIVGLSFKIQSHKTSIQSMIMTLRHIHRQYYTHCEAQPSTKLSLEFSFNNFFIAAAARAAGKNHERKWNSELRFETKHRAHNSKTVH